MKLIAQVELIAIRHSSKTAVHVDSLEVLDVAEGREGYLIPERTSARHDPPLRSRLPARLCAKLHRMRRRRYSAPACPFLSRPACTAGLGCTSSPSAGDVAFFDTSSAVSVVNCLEITGSVISIAWHHASRSRLFRSGEVATREMKAGELPESNVRCESCRTPTRTNERCSARIHACAHTAMTQPAGSRTRCHVSVTACARHEIARGHGSVPIWSRFVHPQVLARSKRLSYVTPGSTLSHSFYLRTRRIAREQRLTCCARYVQNDRSLARTRTLYLVEEIRLRLGTSLHS
ncbi:hypothetical protein DFH11DRAFT_1075508 [Phellopilus nigrolimitatus]|nr:hypothetical protein DFH11DRAFT_1075508 [Phellopilus nigrolimitatus]